VALSRHSHLLEPQRRGNSELRRALYDLHTRELARRTRPQDIAVGGGGGGGTLVNSRTPLSNWRGLVFILYIRVMLTYRLEILKLLSTNSGSKS
jgi:hypothetical protein